MKILNSFFNGYFKQKNAETGRSMVEILGVLAVIGVLSIGGIYGYAYAMKKYTANLLVQEAHLAWANNQGIWKQRKRTGFPLILPQNAGTTC